MSWLAKIAQGSSPWAVTLGQFAAGLILGFFHGKRTMTKKIEDARAIGAVLDKAAAGDTSGVEKTISNLTRR